MTPDLAKLRDELTEAQRLELRRQVDLVMATHVEDALGCLCSTCRHREWVDHEAAVLAAIRVERQPGIYRDAARAVMAVEAPESPQAAIQGGAECG